MRPPAIKNAALFTRTHQGASLHLTESQLDSFALVTQGCFRIADEDIVELRQITDTLENTDPNEYKGYITVKDDLDIPVHYRYRDNIKYDWVRQGGVLPELIVTPMGCETILDFDKGSNMRNLYNK